jgi:hypothetical protein
MTTYDRIVIRWSLREMLLSPLLGNQVHPFRVYSGSLFATLEVAGGPRSASSTMPPSEDSRPPSKRATTGLPQTGDSPGSGRVGINVGVHGAPGTAGSIPAIESYAIPMSCAMPANPDLGHLTKGAAQLAFGSRFLLPSRARGDPA